MPTKSVWVGSENDRWIERERGRKSYSGFLNEVLAEFRRTVDPDQGGRRGRK